MWTHRFSQAENAKSKSRSITFCFTAFQPNLALFISHQASKQPFCSLLLHTVSTWVYKILRHHVSLPQFPVFSCASTTTSFPTPWHAGDHDPAVANKWFLTAFPSLSAADSSINNIAFQNNRARCKEHRITPESFRATLLALQLQNTDPKPPFTCLAPAGGDLTTKSRSSPS